MKSLTITQPGQVQLQDVTHPGGPGAGDVLLKIIKVGLRGSDLSTFRGANPLVLEQFPAALHREPKFLPWT